jgi:SAM-dependent methyltransferase
MPCTHCDGIEQQFGEPTARRQLARLRRRGPDRSTRLLIDAVRAALAQRGARDVRLLDIGAGVGAIHHELLDGAVTRAVHVEASPAQIAVAREEAERRGHAAQVEFVRGDFVAIADTLPSADVVTLDRVICCYHDMNRLVSRSAEKAAHFYGAVYPRAIGLVRLGIASINLLRRLARSAFRVYRHDPGAIDAVLRAAGLERRSMQRTLVWEVVLYERR